MVYQRPVIHTPYMIAAAATDLSSHPCSIHALAVNPKITAYNVAATSTLFFTKFFIIVNFN